MLKIGLTGGIASGKSTVCQLFSQYDVPIIDADVVAKQLVEPQQTAFDEIVLTFGSHIIQADGHLNRSLLRQLIFTDASAKKQLEDILHPKIRQQLSIQSQQCHAKYCILVIPLLIEASMQDMVDRVLVINLSPEQQLERLCLRDGISPDDAHKIINGQCTQQQRLSIADDIIHNNSSDEILAKSVAALHQKYLNLAK